MGVQEELAGLRQQLLDFQGSITGEMNSLKNTLFNNTVLIDTSSIAVDTVSRAAASTVSHVAASTVSHATAFSKVPTIHQQFKDRARI